MQALIEKLIRLRSLSEQEQFEVIEAIHDLDNYERVELREAAIKQGAMQLPANLYFNYDTQEWL